MRDQLFHVLRDARQALYFTRRGELEHAFNRIVLAWRVWAFELGLATGEPARSLRICRIGRLLERVQTQVFEAIRRQGWVLEDEHRIANRARRGGHA